MVADYSIQRLIQSSKGYANIGIINDLAKYGICTSMFMI